MQNELTINLPWQASASTEEEKGREQEGDRDTLSLSLSSVPQLPFEWEWANHDGTAASLFVSSPCLNAAAWEQHTTGPRALKTRLSFMSRPSRRRHQGQRYRSRHRITTMNTMRR